MNTFSIDAIDTFTIVVSIMITIFTVCWLVLGFWWVTGVGKTLSNYHVPKKKTSTRKPRKNKQIRYER